MSSLYRRSIKKLISHLTIDGELTVERGRGRKSKRGGLFEFLEMRQLFSGTPADISTNVFGTETFSSALFSTNFAGGTLADIEITTLPANGTLMFQGAAVTANTSIPASQLNQLTYTPNASFTGTDTAQWDGTDASVFSGTPANLTLNVQTDTAPTVTDVTVSLQHDTSNKTIGVTDFSAQFTDPDSGDTLQVVQVVTLPTHGTLMLGNASVSANQNISLSTLSNTPLTYIPTAGYTGADSFQWSGSDGVLFAAATANVSLTVNDAAPTVSDLTAALQHDSSKAFAAADFSGPSQFTDPDTGDVLQAVKITALPTHGNLTLGGANVTVNQVIPVANLANLTYVPSAGFTGADSFQWNGSDGALFAAASANANLTVNDPAAPTVSNLSFVVVKNANTTFSAGNFTAGFTDTDAGDSLQSVQITALPSNGTLKLSGAAVTLNQTIAVSNLANLTYVPNNGFTGADSFQWNGSDGALFAVSGASANLTVTDTAPTLSNLSTAFLHDTTKTFTATDFSGVFADANGDTLQSVTIVTLPGHGTLMLGNTTVTANQTIPVGSLPLTYVPAAGYVGADNFQWNASDGSLSAAANANVSMNVTDQAPSIGNLTIAVDKNDAKTITASDFLGQFTDPDTGDTLQAVKIVTLPANGTLKLGGANGTAVTAGQTIQLSSLPLTYVPNSGITGTDTFQWEGSDGATLSTAANVTLNVTNSAPTLSNVTIGVPTNNSTALSASNFTRGFHDINANDSIQQLQIISLPTHGNLTLGGANGTTVTANQTLSSADLGTLTYIPDPNYTGSDGFTWSASDGTAFAAAPATATIVRAAATNASYILPEGINSNLSLSNLTAAYSDIANGSLQTITFLSTPSNGTLFVNNTALNAGMLGTPFSLSNLTLTFTPNNPGNPPVPLVDAIQWEGSSGNLTSDIGNIVIASVSPKVTDLSFTGLENLALTIPTNQLASDFFAASRGNPTVFEVTALPTNGTLMINGAPAILNNPYAISNLTIAYTPNNGYTGADSIGFTESIDGTLFPASPANISLTVIGPTVSNATATVGENRSYAFPTTDFSFTSDLTSDGFSPTMFRIVSLPAHGTLTVDGSVVQSSQLPLTVDYSTLSISYRPNTGYTGSDSFTWSLSADGTTFAAAATDALTVSAPSVTAFSIFAGTGTPFAFSTQFSSNFQSAGGALQFVRITKLPAHGVLKLGVTPVTVGQNIPAARIASLTYSGIAGFSGSDTFSWTGGDGAVFASTPAAVTVSVLPPLAVLGNGILIAQNKAPTVTNFTDFASWTLAADASMQNDTRTFTIRNSSNSTMTFSTITLGGANARDFVITQPSITSGGKFSLAPGAAATFTIRFRPLEAGKLSATVILKNGAGVVNYQFAIQGTALLARTIDTDSSGGIVQVASTRTGSGTAATNGHIVAIKYTGYLADGGTIFDASSLHTQTANGFIFRLDNTANQTYLSSASNKDFSFNGIDGSVIAGWEFGLQGIRPGESRTFIINSDAGYGANGTTGIPGGATLIFDVQCVAVDPKPQVGAVALGANNTPVAYITPGETAVTANQTLFSLSNTSTSATESLSYEFFTVGATDANGTPLSNWNFTSSTQPVSLSGHNAPDFSLASLQQVSTGVWVLTINFHPLTPGVKNETVHLHTNDPKFSDFSFNIQGTSTKFANLQAGFDPTLNLPTQTEITGSGQSIQVPVTVSNNGDATFPNNSHTNIQIYARLLDSSNTTSGGALTLVGFVNNIDVSNLQVKGIKRFYPQISLPLGMAAGTYAFEAVVNQASIISNASISALITQPATWASMVQGGGNGANQTMTDDDTVDTTTFPIASAKVHNRLINVIAGQYTLSGSLGSSTVTGTTTGAHGSIVVNVQNLGNVYTNPNQVFSVDILARAVDNSGTVILASGFPTSAGHLPVNGRRSITVPVSYTGALNRTGYILVARIRMIDSGNNNLSGTQIISLDQNLSPVLFYVS
ncbi:MAG TPA: Ig-like domain-containing protein [Phycisphaerae bacterium]|nr:Ig-like domain-containing protein [Phycisphaerae bacterium]